jgi:hypothetical protein
MCVCVCVCVCVCARARPRVSACIEELTLVQHTSKAKWSQVMRFGAMEALNMKLWILQRSYVCMVCRQFSSILGFSLWVCPDFSPRHTRVHFPMNYWEYRRETGCVWKPVSSVFVWCVYFWKPVSSVFVWCVYYIASFGWTMSNQNLQYLISCPTVCSMSVTVIQGV